MSIPLLVALGIYLLLLLGLLAFSLIMLVQIHRFSFVGDRTTLAIQLYSFYIVLVLLTSSILLTQFDWATTPYLEIF